MRLSAATTLALGIALLAPPARSDSWGPYSRNRTADAEGRYYVVLEAAKEGGEKGAFAFTFAQRKEGTAPVTSVREDPWGDTRGADAGVRPGDAVLARGRLRNGPLEVRVSPSGAGFVAFESYMGIGYGDEVVWVARDGKVGPVKRLADLFSTEEIAEFSHSVSSIHWFRHGWLDDAGKRIVVVAAGNLIRVVDLATGEVKKGGQAEIVHALSLPESATQAAALELAVEMRLPDVGALPQVLLADETAPLVVRLRAAVALATRSDLRGADLVRATATVPRKEGVSVPDWRYAIRHLPDLVGMEAVPVLRDALRGPANEAWSDAQGAFSSLGEAAVPALVAMLAETGQSSDYRGAAAHALNNVRSEKALPALLATIADPEEYVANAAANAAIEIGKERIAPDLVALLEKGTTQDDRLAMYFADFKSPAAVKPLVRAMARYPAGSYERGAIAEALAFQTGRSFGEDLAAWEAWLAKGAK